MNSEASMKPTPTNLERISEHELQITWSDGQIRRYTAAELRDRCPCATCREKRKAQPAEPELLPVLSIEETQPSSVTGMRPVGNYAYNIQFNDGHDTGIFTLEFLRELGTEES